MGSDGKPKVRVGKSSWRVHRPANKTRVLINDIPTESLRIIKQGKVTRIEFIAATKTLIKREKRD